MRRIILSLATAAILGVGLAAAPTSAHAQYYGGGGYYDHDGWRERAWREHQWRERQAWAWRHHLWQEWRWHNSGY
jgi:hypothetical protein